MEARRALHDLESAIGTDRFVYVDYHLFPPLSADGTPERGRGYYGVRGTPTVWVDGRAEVIGIESLESRYRSAILEAEGDSAVVSVATRAAYDARSRIATVTIEVEAVGEVPFPGECVVRALLMEDGVPAQGRTFDRTVRQLLWEAPLEAVLPGRVQSVVRTFRLPEGWNAEAVSAVAWVQRDSTVPERHREVLNADRAAPLGATPVVRTSWGEIKSRFR